MGLVNFSKFVFLVNFIIQECKFCKIAQLFCVSFSHERKSERNERILFHKIPALASDFVRVSASESVPQTILASQDNGENEQEIVDLTVETVNAVSTISDDANVTVTATPERVLKVSKSQKHFFLKLHCPKNDRNI